MMTVIKIGFWTKLKIDESIFFLSIYALESVRYTILCKMFYGINTV